MYNNGTFNSQLCQDRFVNCALQGKKNGYFVDLGAGTDGVRHQDIGYYSNTYFLEHHLSWTGLAVDMDEVWAARAQKERNCSVACVNLEHININQLLSDYNVPERVEYISFDAGLVTDRLLEELDLNKYTFEVVTFEHNAYIGPDYYPPRDRSREIFADHGYELVCEDIVYAVPGINGPVEDWYVHSSVMNDHIRSLKCSNVDCSKIIN